MNDDIWKAIPGYEGLYEAGASGRIRSLRSGCTLSPSANGRYEQVWLCKFGRKEHLYVHRLVLAAFFPDQSGIARHLNGNPRDNRQMTTTPLTTTRTMGMEMSGFRRLASRFGYRLERWILRKELRELRREKL